MARRARVEFAGAFYHVLDRGDRREDIFRGDPDRHLFLDTLGQACARTGWRIHAWVLMSNHYHLLLETPRPNLVAGMSWFQTTYTARFNRRHRLCGHLFQGRYKAVLVDPEAPSYFATLSDYIHLNPVRARLVNLEQRLFDYPWSSYRWFAATSGRPAWFTPETVLAELGLDDDSTGRRKYAERMRSRAVEELSEQAESPTRRELRQGWCLGCPAFRERMLALLDLAGETVQFPRRSRRSERRGQATYLDKPIRRGRLPPSARWVLAVPKSARFLRHGVRITENGGSSCGNAITKKGLFRVGREGWGGKGPAR